MEQPSQTMSAASLIRSTGTSSGTATTGVFIGIWAVLLIGGRSRLFRDPGTFWHTLTGDRIFASGFPRTDWLSFTFAGQPWIAHQWLGECAMSALHRLGGLDALLVATSAAVALLFAWLFHRLIAAGVRPVWAVMFISLAMLATSHHLHVRPHILSILFFAWMYARLADFDTGRIRLRGLVVLWPLFLLWVNSHGAVVGGLATFGLAIAGWTVARIAGRNSPIRTGRDAAALFALFIACTATVLINPYGLEMPRAWSAILWSPELPRMIVEQASLVRTRSWQVLALAAVYVVAIVGTIPRWPVVTGVLPLVWLVLAFDRVRHAPFFAVAATIALPGLLSRARWIERLARRQVEIVQPRLIESYPFPRAPFVASAIALATVALIHRAAPQRGPLIARLDSAYWPVDLLPELRTAERELPPGSPILNDMLYGGFIAYYMPRLRVFVDDRWELYGDGFMVAQQRSDTKWLGDWVSRFDVSLALAQHGSGLEHYLESDSGWQRVATSPAGGLYRRGLQTRLARPGSDSRRE